MSNMFTVTDALGLTAMVGPFVVGDVLFDAFPHWYTAFLTGMIATVWILAIVGRMYQPEAQHT